MALAAATQTPATANAFTKYEDAPALDHPFFVTIKNSKGGYCSGAFTSETRITTAAHCITKGGKVDNGPYTVYLGAEKENSEKKTFKESELNVFKVDGAEDVGVISFKKEKPFANKKSHLEVSEKAFPDRAVMDLYGSGDIPKDKRTGTVHRMKVVAKISKPKDPKDPKEEGIKAIAVGAHYKIKEKDVDQSGGAACSGDSGGPMTMTDDGKLKLYGVISTSTAAGKDKCNTTPNLNAVTSLGTVYQVRDKLSVNDPPQK
ncbi:trypsin-like serine protease [Streptomyces olivoreticuli]